MCPDERLAGLWMVSPVSLEPRLSLALWSLREAIFFFCAVKLSGSFFSCARFCLQRIFWSFGFAVFSLVPSRCGTLFFRRGLFAI
ncbi:hypothetical protein NPIL_116291 [Nephila pilipes]|uniref:Uncharacterized protein n=1 Tax=Nephila pilipes TaxID=299642 RepID=A0A8X6U9T6_NEPPI|nr:hypothetical protein NPIL_116291 [Nephila pilipes]